MINKFHIIFKLRITREIQTKLCKLQRHSQHAGKVKIVEKNKILNKFKQRNER